MRGKGLLSLGLVCLLAGKTSRGDICISLMSSAGSFVSFTDTTAGFLEGRSEALSFWASSMATIASFYRASSKGTPVGFLEPS